MQFLAAITFFVLLNIIVRLPNNIKISSKDYIETIGTVYAYKKEHFANSYQFSMIVHYTINGNTYEIQSPPIQQHGHLIFAHRNGWRGEEFAPSNDLACAVIGIKAEFQWIKRLGAGHCDR